MLSAPAVLVCALVAQAPARGDPAEVEAELRRAKNEYAYGNYQRAADQLFGLLYPMRLSNDDQVIETRKYLALSYYLLGKANAAREEFGKLLYLSPDYQLDPYTVPPPIIDLFESTRGAMKPELDAIRQRKSDEQVQAVTQRGYVRQIEQTFYERSSFATLLPFGAGQFENGDYGWGALFAVTEVALLAVNIGSYVWASRYGPTYSDPDIQRRVQVLTVAQYGTLALFGVTWSLGVFQARLRFQPVMAGPRLVHDEPPPGPGAPAQPAGPASAPPPSSIPASIGPVGGGMLNLQIRF